MGTLRMGTLTGVAAAAMLAGASIGQVQVGQVQLSEPVSGDVVNPTDGVNIPEPFAPGVDEANMLPFPPIDTIPPLPMPDPDLDGYSDPNGSQAVTFYNAETGETSVYNPALDNPDAFGEGGGWIPNGLAVDTSIENQRAFGNMTLAGGLGTFPRSPNVKLIQRYVTTTGADAWFVCSGTMNDSGVILTAAHCVYNRSSNINNWAAETFVIPAWDGNGSILPIDANLNNFGWARASSYIAGTDYINNGNFDRDMGAMRIDNCSRSVGFLTGWFGWAYGGSCTGRTYHNFSYPSENCGGGLHNGRDMYYWNGTFDSCPGNQQHINTTGGCFNAGWGGMSGSGAYYISGADRFVHSVASNSNRSTSFNYTQMWLAFKDSLVAMEATQRGTVFDLEALQFRAGGADTATVTAGNSLAASTVQVINATNANPASGTYTLGIYLSTNNNISTFDTSLATWNYSTNFAAMNNKTFNVPAPSIPLNTPSGNYWVGTVIDTSEDTNSCNNDSDTWDAVAVTVNGVADPKADSISVPSGTFFYGDPMAVAYSITNQGGDPTTTITVSIRASTNTIISTFDPEIGSFSHTGLNGSATLNANQTVTIPSSLGQTNRFIGMIITASNDVDGSNNTAFDPVAITVDGRADLRANSVSAPSGTFFLCSSIAVGTSVQNIGDITSGNYSVEVRASTNTTITTFDTLLGTFNYSTLGAGLTRNSSVNVAFPIGLNPNNYFIGIIVSNGTNENVLNNNTAFDAVPLTVVDCEVDLNNDCNVDVLDFFAFIGLFNALNPAADLNHDGNIDVLDFFAFITLFNAGC